MKDVPPCSELENAQVLSRRWCCNMTDLKRWTRAEVALRSGRDNGPVWLIYKDAVYDVSKYLAEHPAGDVVILDEAGTDATKAFDEVGHSSDARTIMAKYKIGELVEEDKHYDENGKKKKRVVVAQQPDGETKSCMSRLTCGLLG